MNRDYTIGKQHKAMADALHRIEQGTLKRLMILCPPRHGKSQLASEYFPAWFLGRNPSKYVIGATYGQDLANDFGRKVRNQLLDGYFQAIFPLCKLMDDSQAKNRFNTTRGGVYYSVGAGSAVTGRGADILILDDLIKGRKEAESELIRKSIKDWYAAVAYTRLMPGGAIINIMTRWHEDDLAGWIMREHAHEGWEVLSFPAIDDDGKALWEEKYPVQELEVIRKTIGDRDWESLYQQRPTSVQGSIFQKSWWRTYTEAPLHFKKIVQSWDTAFKKGAENDYSVCTTWGVHTSGYYILDCWKDRVEFPELKRTVISLAQKHKPHVVLIEDKASGQSLIQELKRNTAINILPVKVDADKITRAYAVTSTIESGNVLLPENAKWTHDFIEELSMFPHAKHDDICDSITQAIQYLKQRVSESSAFQEYSIAKQMKKHVWIQIDDTQDFSCEKCNMKVRLLSDSQTPDQVASNAGRSICL